VKPVVAHVLHRLYLAGAEVLAAALARRLGERFTFLFLCLDEIGPLGAQLAGEGFTVVDLKRKPGIDLSVGRRMKQLTREHRIDLLHAHQYTPFFYSALSRGLRGGFTGRPPILFTEHGRHYPDPRKLKRIAVNKLLLRPGDRVTAVGRFVKRALVDKEGIRDSRIEVIYNGIDGDTFTPDATGQLRATVRGELGIAADQPVVLQVARFHPVKDHATAVRAFAAAKAQMSGQPPLLLLAGEGELKADIETLASQLGIADAVRFLGVRGDVPRLMAAADVFMLSSLSEGVSVTLLEAMGAGLPIAATDVGGNSEVVAANESGLLSPRGDAQGLGRNLVTLLRDAGLRRRMGEGGRARLLQTFTQDRMHERYAELYDELASVRRSREA